MPLRVNDSAPQLMLRRLRPVQRAGSVPPKTAHMGTPTGCRGCLLDWVTHG